MIPVVLASASPRRRFLMRQAGIPCIIMPCDADETIADGLTPGEAVIVISERKALSAQGQVPTPAVIIAADTLVCIHGALLGKPKTEQDAFRMLKTLQGAFHTVYTGVTLIKTETGRPVIQQFTEEARVYMRALDDREIRSYIATKEPMDKAGAYGIQEKGSLLIERIEGDYHTVVGLPMARLCLALKNWGIDALSGWKEETDHTP